MQALDNLHLLVEFLAHQQFYSRDDDVILSRDTNTRIRIPGARIAVDIFIDALITPISHIHNGEYDTYLTKIAEKLPIESKEILENLDRTKEVLETNRISDEIATNVLVGGIRHSLHKTELQKFFNEVLEKAEKLNGFSTHRSQLIAKLDALCERSDPDVALLHNLVLLKLLASTYSLRNLENSVDDLIAKKKESLVNKLFSHPRSSAIEISKEK